MVRSSKFTCVLDTNVLFPLHIRDYLFYLADAELYNPHWSQHIFAEWENLMIRKRFSKDKIKRALSIPDRIFPFAKVYKYEHLIEMLDGIQDPDDRHVLAAAIRINANLIVTWNLKHFPDDYLEQFGLRAVNPDFFIADLIDLHNDEALEAFRSMVLAKKDPPIDEMKMIEILRKNKLVDTANYLRAII